MINWFPLASKLYTRSDFTDLPITAKIYFLELVSKANSFRGEFYKADDYFAIKFDVSTKTIRRHRKKLNKIGLINMEPGKLGKGGQKLATRYLNVSYSNAKDCPVVDDYINFARIHRFTFNGLIEKAKFRELNINDVWVWVTLWWWKQNHKTDNNQFFITKNKLEELTGYGQTVKSVKKISQYTNLIEYQERYHKINFSDWTWWADPLKSDNKDTFEPKIQRELEQKRKKEETKDLKKFLRYFKNEYKIIHNKKCNVSPNQKIKVNHLLDKHGLKTLKETANKYFYADNIPKTTGTNKKTLARFTNLIQEGYFKNLSD